MKTLLKIINLILFIGNLALYGSTVFYSIFDYPKSTVLLFFLGIIQLAVMVVLNFIFFQNLFSKYYSTYWKIVGVYFFLFFLFISLISKLPGNLDLSIVYILFVFALLIGTYQLWFHYKVTRTNLKLK